MNRNQAILKAVQVITMVINGGKGSGNFGHAGRPGKRGGSGTGGAYASVSEQLGRRFNTRVKAQKKADALAYKDFDYYSEMTIVNQEEKLINEIFVDQFKKHGLDINKVTVNQLDWSEGNGPRDSRTGEFLSEPNLQKNKNRPEHKLHRQLTQDTLRSAGITELTLYRGIREGEPDARGYTSFSTNKAVAETFGSRVMTKKVKIKDVVAHYQVHYKSNYPSEQEVIVDLH